MSKWDDLYYRESSKRERELQEEMAELYAILENGDKNLYTYLANCYRFCPYNVSTYLALSFILSNKNIDKDRVEELSWMPRRDVPDWQIEIREILTSMHLTYEVF